MSRSSSSRDQYASVENQKIGSDEVLKTEPSKISHSFRRISNRNCVQYYLQFKLKVTKNNFTCIQRGDEEQFRTLPDDIHDAFLTVY